ncbi:hypothetical protein Aduo_006773 [Ancylostoma duodenale]
MDSDEMRPEQLPSLYGEIEKNALGKVLRPSVVAEKETKKKHEHGPSPNATPSTYIAGEPHGFKDNKGLDEVQGTMEDESERLLVQETQRSSPTKPEAKPEVMSSYLKESVVLNELGKQPLQPFK